MIDILKLTNEKVDEIIKIIFRYAENDLKEFRILDVAIVSLLNVVVERTSSIILLIDNNRTESIETLTRTVMEAYVYLRYIIKDKNQSSKRGEAFVYSTRLENFGLYDTILKHRSIINSLVNLNEYEDRIKKEVENNRILQTKYRECFPYLKKGDEAPKKWYANRNPKIKNFKELCEYLGETFYYDFFYYILSKEVHLKDSTENLVVSDRLVQLKFPQKQSALVIALIRDMEMKLIGEVLCFYNKKEEAKKLMELIRLNLKMKKRGNNR